MAIKVGSSQGKRGIAEVSFNKQKKQLSVQMDDERYNILMEDAPKYLINILMVNPSMPFRINMNSDGTQIFSAGPKGRSSYFAVLDHFAAKEGEQPSPKMVPGGPRQKKDGKSWVAPDQLQFTAVFRVVVGPYAASATSGCEIAYNVPYAFKPTPEGMQIAGTGSKKCSEFLMAAGMDFVNDTIPVQENILPWLEKTLKEREFVVVLSLNEDGYVDTIAPAPEGTIRPQDTIMEEPTEFEEGKA